MFSTRAVRGSTCTRIPWSHAFACAGDGAARTEVRTFDTTTPGPAGAVGVAGRARLHPCRDGGDRRLLEAGLAHPVRWRVRADPGQRRARQERARPQDRRQRRALAGRSAGARPDPRQLRAGGADAGDARPAAHPQAVGARAGQPRPADAEDAGGRQHQARLGADRHHGRQRPRHARGADRRRDRSGQAAHPGAARRQGAAGADCATPCTAA